MLWMYALAGLSLANATEAEQVLTEIVAEIAPLVEEVAQRKFQTLPSIHVEPPIEPENLEYQHGEVVLATYTSHDNTIRIGREEMRDLYRQMATSRDLVQPTITCLLAHELTHALQAHNVRRVETQEERRNQTVLLEGHAQSVGRRVCERLFPDRGIPATMDIYMGVDQLSEAENTKFIRAYGFSRLWLEDLEAQRGVSSVWEALANPPIRAEDLRAKIDNQLSHKSTDPSFLSEPFRKLVRGKTRNIDNKTLSLRKLLIGRGVLLLSPTKSKWAPSLGRLSPPRDSSVAAARWGRSGVFLAMYRMAGSEAARDVIVLRRTLAKNQIGDVRGVGVRPFRAARRLAGADDSLLFGIGHGNEGTIEYWLCAGDLVVVAIANNHAIPAGLAARTMEMMVSRANAVKAKSKQEHGR